MNYADFGLGTWHPTGGMYSVIEGIEKLARELGVILHTNAPVEEITVEGKHALGIKVDGKQIKSDLVVSGADYHHTEMLLRGIGTSLFRKILGEQNLCTLCPDVLPWE